MKLSRETDYNKLKQDIRNDKKSLTDDFSHSKAMNILNDFLSRVEQGGERGTGTLYKDNGELKFNIKDLHLPRNVEHERLQAEQLKKDIQSIDKKFLCRADYETWINSLSYPDFAEFKGNTKL